MQGLIEYMFSAAAFVPHGYCLLWRPDLVAIHAVSDGAIALAYLIIPAAIMTFVRRRKDLEPEHIRIAALFMAFIVACSLTHLASLATLWFPYYGAQGLMKLATAFISLATAFAVWGLLPKLLALPAPAQLASESAGRLALLEELRATNAALEARVAERTRELAHQKSRLEAALVGSGVSLFTQDRDLVCTWIHNPPLGRRPDDLLGRGETELPELGADPALLEAKRRVMATGLPEVREREVRSDGSRLVLRLHVRPERDETGAVSGIVCAAVDITAESEQAERLSELASALAAAAHRFDVALEGSRITVFQQDRDLRYTWIYNAPSGYEESRIGGRTDLEVLPPEGAAVIVPMKRGVIESGREARAEVSLDGPDGMRWYVLRVVPLRRGEAVAGITAVAMDITDQKNQQAQMRVVMRELTHRSKNLLAIVQAIARQTALSVETLEAFTGRFAERLQALSFAHDILVDESWRGAPLRELVLGQLGFVLEGDGGRVSLDGEDLLLRPEAAQNLALALHELATNATKYGALSAPDGTVAISWRLHREDGELRVHLKWRERGGPPVLPPARRGFGRLMIERLVPRALDGEVELHFNADGLSWEIDFPADNNLAGKPVAVPTEA